MEIHIVLATLYYLCGFIYLIYDANERRKERKKLVETLDKLDKSLNESKLIER